MDHSVHEHGVGTGCDRQRRQREQQGPVNGVPVRRRGDHRELPRRVTEQNGVDQPGAAEGQRAGEEEERVHPGGHAWTPVSRLGRQSSTGRDGAYIEVDFTPSECCMRLSRILREGFVAGLIGAGAVALWFLLVDTVNGRPFFTPAMLGSAVFWHTYDPAQVVIEYSRIIGYTMIHVSAFVVVGVIAAALAAEVEEAPHTLFLVVVFTCFFEDRKSVV